MRLVVIDAPKDEELRKMIQEAINEYDRGILELAQKAEKVLEDFNASMDKVEKLKKAGI